MRPPAPVGWFATVASVVSLGILATLAFPQESPTSNAFARAEETQADLAAMKRFEQATFTKELETVATEVAEPILLPDAGPEEKMGGTARALEERPLLPLAPFQLPSTKMVNTNSPSHKAKVSAHPNAVTLKVQAKSSGTGTLVQTHLRL